MWRWDCELVWSYSVGCGVAARGVGAGGFGGDGVGLVGLVVGGCCRVSVDET